MYIYFIIWFFIAISNFLFSYKTYFGKLIFLLIFLFLFLFVGLRFEVGGDWESYQILYEEYRDQDFLKALLFLEPGYSILNILSQYLNIKDTILVNSLSALMVFSFLYVCFTKMRYYWLCLLIYYPYHILVVSLGYTRQSIAVAILIYAFILLLENKKYNYIFFVLLAACFHKTAIIFILFYPLYFLKEKRYLLIIYQILSFILITGVLYLSSINENSIYTSNEVVTSSGVFMRLSMHIIPLVCYFLFRGKVFKNDHVVLDYFVLLIFYCFGLSFVFSTLADRFNLYLIFFDLYVLVRMFDFWHGINRKIFLFPLFLFYTIFIVIWLMNSDFVKLAWIPYQNYITNYFFNYVV